MDGQTRRTHSSRPEHLQRPDTRPVGVFDSGVGGLTVLHECLVNLPHEDFVYLGDTGSFPYGPRTIEDVRALAFRNTSFLVAQRSEVDRGGLQLRHRGRLASAAGGVRHAHRGRGHARGAGRRTGDAQPARRPHGQRGHRAVGQLPAGPADPRRGPRRLPGGLPAPGPADPRGRRVV